MRMRGFLIFDTELRNGRFFLEINLGERRHVDDPFGAASQSTWGACAWPRSTTHTRIEREREGVTGSMPHIIYLRERRVLSCDRGGKINIRTTGALSAYQRKCVCHFARIYVEKLAALSRRTTITSRSNSTANIPLKPRRKPKMLDFLVKLPGLAACQILTKIPRFNVIRRLVYGFSQPTTVWIVD